MTLLAQVFGLQSFMLGAAIESLVVIKLLPNYYSSQNHLSTVAVIVFANLSLYSLFWVLIYPNFLSPLRRLPGPRSLISVVHRGLTETKRPPGELYLDIEKKYPGEELLSLSAFEQHILVAKPRLLADLLVHRSYDFIKPTKISGFLRHVLGDGLVIVEGNQHKFLRKNTMPAFSFRHIKDLYPMMWGKAVLLTETLKREAADNGEGKGTGVIELSAWASRVTLDIIGIAGMGRNFNMLRKSEDPLLSIYEQLTDPSLDKLTFALASITFGTRFVQCLPWNMNQKLAHLSKSLADIYLPMIQEKREAIATDKDDHFDVLSLLIKSNNFSDTELMDSLLTFLAAGHETTASALTWTCYLLTKYPEMQTRLRAEVREALPAGSAAEPADLAGILDQLPLLNGIINETLRLYPTVPMTMRTAICDTRLGDQFIPKGTRMILSMWQMNRSTEVWGPDGGEFRPERWITDAGKPNQNGGANSNYEFLTFLHGPRSCIGQGFARAEMRCLLAALIQSFSWQLAMDEAKILPRGVITIKPAHGLMLKLTPLED